MRIGAALLDHGGSLTALSIVEVPEGMPLSEAPRAPATRAGCCRECWSSPPRASSCEPSERQSHSARAPPSAVRA